MLWRISFTKGALLGLLLGVLPIVTTGLISPEAGALERVRGIKNEARSPFNIRSNEEKLRSEESIINKLIQLRDASPHGIINVNETFAREFMLARSRPYTFIFVTSADKRMCPYCSELRKHLEQISPHLKSSSGEPIRDEFGAPVFLIELMANKHRSLAKFLDLQGVPAIALLTPFNLLCYDSHNQVVNDPAEYEICRIHDDNVLALRTAILDHMELLNSFYKAMGRTDISERLNRSIYQKRLTYVGIFVVSVGSLALYFFTWIRDQMIKHQQIIAVLALAAFFLSTSGLIYNLQHNMEFVGYNWQRKQTILISPQGRQQYVAEGLLFSAACVLGSLAFYCGARLPRFLIHRDSSFWEGKSFWINTSVIILMLMGIGAYKLTQLGTRIKKLSADLPFFPEGMTRGPVRADRMYAF